MALTSFQINGTEVNPRLETFEIRETINDVSTLTCEVTTTGSPVVQFAVHDPVIAIEDGAKIFAGTVTQLRLRGDGGPNVYDEDGDPEIVTTITAEDYGRLAERKYVTLTVADGTALETFLTTLVAELATFGVTLHPSQVTGPNLPAMEFVRKRPSEVLKSLSDATGFVWRIDYDKQLRMWAPGDLAAPFNIDEFDNPARWEQDVEVEYILDDDYANRVIVVSEPIEAEDHVESFTGDGVQDTFTLEWTFIRDWGYVTDDANAFPSPINKGLQRVGEFDGEWELDVSAGTITRLIGPLPSGQVAQFKFHGTFQAEAVAEDAAEIAANGLFEIVVTMSDISTDASAQEIADALLAERLNASDQIVRYNSRFTAPTLRAAQAQTLTATARNVSGSYVIQDLRVRAEYPMTVANALVRTVTAKRQALTGKWQRTYEDWLKFGKGGGVTQAPVVAVPSGGPAPPFESVQTNQNGAFAGKSTFIFKLDNNSVVMGLDSSITAVSYNSCAIFGDNCHIVD